LFVVQEEGELRPSGLGRERGGGGIVVGLRKAPDLIARWPIGRPYPRQEELSMRYGDVKRRRIGSGRESEAAFLTPVLSSPHVCVSSRWIRASFVCVVVHAWIIRSLT
jgi:hypothetical protein